MDIDQNQQLLENLIDSVNVPEKVSIKALKGILLALNFTLI
jgi:hypothetical protein